MFIGCKKLFDVFFSGGDLVSVERSASCRKPDELRLLRMTSGSGSTPASASTGSCGTACTTVDGASSSSASSRRAVPRRVFSTRATGGRAAAGGRALGGDHVGGGGGGPVSRAKLKTVKLTAAVVLSYFVCWSPYFISHLWSVWDDEAPYQGTIVPHDDYCFRSVFQCFPSVL